MLQRVLYALSMLTCLCLATPWPLRSANAINITGKGNSTNLSVTNDVNRGFRHYSVDFDEPASAELPVRIRVGWDSRTAVLDATIWSPAGQQLNTLYEENVQAREAYTLPVFYPPTYAGRVVFTLVVQGMEIHMDGVLDGADRDLTLLVQKEEIETSRGNVQEISTA